MLPISLKIKGRLCLVVGAGPVGSRKALDLLAQGARVQLISPTLCALMQEFLQQNDRFAIENPSAVAAIQWQERKYQEGEAGQYFMVFAATNFPQVNQQIFADAEKAGRLVNVIDVPDLCNFYSMAVVDRSPLLIAISTNGNSPALAGRIRKQLSEQFTPQWSKLLPFISQFRQEYIALESDLETRMNFLKNLVYRPEVDQFLQGQEEDLRRLCEGLLTTKKKEITDSLIQATPRSSL